ncbi:unnamed protein product [Orchesella dallaii]|uniref:F-box domain-containing protein n=1 Tax=Orchesella dallaii TaxID=48710 RepID=A0ABP1QV15_9HEXA
MDAANVVLASSTSSITDLPPEMLKLILAELDNDQNSLLPYRLVHPQWKAIIHDLLEEKCLKRKLDGCPEVCIVEKDTNNELVILCPARILEHTGNPFPSSSLKVSNSIKDTTLHRAQPHYQQRSQPNSNQSQKVHLEQFISKFGNCVTSFTLQGLVTSSDVIANILSHLTNLKTLIVAQTIILDSKYDNLPQLFNRSLTTLELRKSSFKSMVTMKEMKVSTWFFAAYSNQLKKLVLHFSPLSVADPRLIPKGIISDHGGAFNPFGNLQELRITGPIDFFRCRLCIPPLKRLIIIGMKEMDAKELMLFIHKFSNTLERLELNFKWDNLFHVNCEVFGLLRNPMNSIPFGVHAAVVLKLLSIPMLKFPKLKHFTVAYPNTDAELRIINEAFLVKFPALQRLQLLLFGGRLPLPSLQCHNEYYIELLQNQTRSIQDFFRGVNYWKLCSGLKSISVVARKQETIPDETGDVVGGLVYSTTRDEYESSNVTFM